MTDQDKEEIGIMPECVYMATNLLENLGEQLSVVGEMEAVVVGEMEGSGGEGVRGRLGSRTDPNVFQPKIRRQLQHRASEYPNLTQLSLKFLLVAYLMSMLLYSQPPLSLLQSNLEMGSDSQMVVSRMVCWGEGVWVSYKGSSTLELFHTVTQFERSV